MRAVAVLLVLVAVAWAHERCGTPQHSVEDKIVADGILTRFRQRVCSNVPEAFFCSAEARKEITTIPLAVHVIYNPSNMDGYLSDAEVQRQVDQINLDYAGNNQNGVGYQTSWQFSLQTITRTGNADWFNFPTRYEFEFKRQLAIDPTNVFNQYFTNFAGGLLGFCYLPDSFPEDDYRHGCVNHYASIPGGDLFPYNGGQTTTHEIGHGLGLYHVFDGSCNCEGFNGDRVNDTTCQISSTNGCPSNANSCGTPDNIHNFMDYSFDSCMYEFTLGQSIRMDEQVALYKPGFLSRSLREKISSLVPDAWKEAHAFQILNSRNPKKVDLE